MHDIERIGKIISDINKYFSQLESYNINSVDELFDSMKYNASSMAVFAILNRVIDLGGEIISAENLGAPNTYQDIMPVLAKANVLNKEQSEKLNKLVKKRNILAHFYEDMNEKELFKTIKELFIIKDFLRIIVKRIKI